VEKLRKKLKLILEKTFRQNFKITHSLGRIMVPLESGFDEALFVKKIKNVFGIKYFRFVYEGDMDINVLGSQIWASYQDDFVEKAENFRVKVKRSMNLSYSSLEAEQKIGAVLLEKGIVLKVKMKNPDLEVNVEFFNDHGYFSFKKYQGQGGLSPGSQGKLISLLSSGIDSPVAAFRMMRRGARVIFVTFHAYPYSDKDEMEQVKELTEILSNYQYDTKLYAFPFGDFQKEVGTNLKIPGNVRTIIYRRMMLRIAERVARKERAMGLVTGDSFGQVASQTPENLFTIHDATNIPLYQPLIGYDKEEIIRLSEDIGTYEISKLPCKDSCTMFTSRNPELKSRSCDLNEYEKNLPIDEWIEKVLNQGEVIFF
jgi:thiamine biosynthesis protein ThiI